MAGHLACSQVEAKIGGAAPAVRQRGAARVAPRETEDPGEYPKSQRSSSAGQRRARNLKPHSGTGEGPGVKTQCRGPESAEGCKTDPEPDMDAGRAGVRNMRSKCRCSYVLQFTFRRAVCCVLHRPPSQVIHCAVLSLHDKKPLSSFDELANNQTAHACFPSRGEERGLRSPRARRSTLSGQRTSRRGPVRGASRREPRGLRHRSRDVTVRRQTSRGPRQPGEAGANAESPPAAEEGCVRYSPKQAGNR